MLKKLMVTTVLIAGFLFTVSLVSLYLQFQLYTYGICPIPIPVLVPTFASLGVFVGSLVYYFMIGRIEKGKAEKEEMLKLFLEFLESDERKVLEELIRERGVVTQARLSRMLGKVRAWRTAEKLRSKGIVEKRARGKTNLIVLNERLSKVMVGK